MERRINKYNTQLSPERAKVWKEKSPKYHYSSNKISKSNQTVDLSVAVVDSTAVAKEEAEELSLKKVAVVYYLCRNRQLEHPHFIEVPLSSPKGLYLRDVIQRLNVLRGRCMASMYSWSCKRSYKNGYVWHDLCEDDLVLPAHGNEYVLKGSELFEENNSSGRVLQNSKALPEPLISRNRDDSSSSSSMNGNAPKLSQDDELSPPAHRSSSSDISPVSSIDKNSSWNGSLSLTEYKIYKNDGLADASTQTEEEKRVPPGPEPEPETTSSPPQCSSSASKTDTLENLIKADASKFNSFRILEDEELKAQNNTKLKASNMLMQLITCGSISVKDNNFGLIPSYLHSKLLFTELDNNTKFVNTKEDKEYFSGSFVEKMSKEIPVLKRSSSYNADRTSKQFDIVEEKDETKSKCIPRSIKGSLIKQPRSESMRSPLSDGPRISSARTDSSRNIGTSSKTPSRKSESFREEDNVIKIEESLLRELGL